MHLLVLAIIRPTDGLFAGDTAYYLQGLTDGYRAPLYGLFLHNAIKLGPWFPIAIQSALTILSGIVAYVALGDILAGLLIATCPFLALFDVRLLSESLYINLLWLGWVSLQRRHPGFAGILVGLSILTRDTLVLIPLCGAALFLFNGKWKQGLVFAAVAYAAVLPWVVYNGALTQGRAGMNIWAGTWERNTGWYLEGVNHPELPDYAFRSASERQYVLTHWNDDGALKRLAIQRIEGDPVGVVKTWIMRYPRLWLSTRADHVSLRGTRGGVIWTAEKLLFYALNLAFLAFGGWGLWKTDRPLFAVPVLYAAIVYIPFHAEARYTLFAFPFLIALGSRRLGRTELRFKIPFQDEKSAGTDAAPAVA